MSKVFSKFHPQKPFSLGEGAKRVAQYATRNKKTPHFVETTSIGSNENFVGIRKYSNGVMMFLNDNGLVILPDCDTCSENLAEELAYRYPVAATLRHTKDNNLRVNKFYDFLNKVKTIIFGKNKKGKTIIKSSFTESRTNAKKETYWSLQTNREKMLKVLGFKIDI